MADGPFKSMTRECRRSLADWGFAMIPAPPGHPSMMIPYMWRDRGEGAKCERCGCRIFAGDWPWCKGNPEDHER